MAIYSELFTAGLAVIVIGFIIVWHLMKRWPTWNFPPGPIGIPFFGSILSLTPSVHYDFDRIRKKYGDIFSIMLGDSVIVAVNNVQLVKEILRRTETSNRNFFWSQSQFSNPHKEGIFDQPYGDKWRTQRQFALNTLRDFGFGKRCMEKQIAEEIKTLVSLLKEKDGELVDMKGLYGVSVSNIMCRLIFNKNYDHNDEEFIEIVDLVNQALRIQGRAYDFIPLARVFQRKTIASDKKLWMSFYDFLTHEIKSHRQTYQVNDNRDFIDAAIGQECIDPDNFSNECIKMNVTSLFIAGTETTSSTLSWIILYMGLHPEIQEKVFLEIEKVVGSNRYPELNDQTEMPYTIAVIYEAQRIASVTPFVTRKTSETISIGGYNLPNGTVFVANLWAVHHDEPTWKKPYDFVPERFLNRNGGVLMNENLLAFGGGRRICLGMSLAKMELFLFFTFLTQHFKFDFPIGSLPPSLDGDLGLTLSNKPYKIRVTSR
ncbi:cytochrome P450 2J6-like [Antedon mediterranea]|uniref:cytochrome P450 2J6-like n=1 Tax=Antedon mediterranea TaxID=105859 RepID=UPI003AF9E825